ncbi:MAG TPA: hypothetical protein VFJ16_02530 [Longimicrobium sp.]|nr:hypothetical protein [Longimicrobium sp.]
MTTHHKLRLQLDQLEVETFRTDAVAVGRGTVRGHEPYDTSTGDYRGCACQTADNTCAGSCAPSCQFTCPGRPGCEDNDTNYLTCMMSCGWEGGQAVEFPNC